MINDLLNLPKKSRPAKLSYVHSLKPRETLQVAEFEGPGCITCFNIVLHRKPNLGRQLILKIYWDGEESPSVEAPIADFFGVGFGEIYYPVNNAFFSVKHQTGYSCYFPMPFAKSARIELEAGDEEGGAFIFIDWSRFDEPLEEDMRFHAKWRRAFPAPAYGEEYLIMDAVGRGRFMGYSYSLCQHDTSERWSHAGAEQIYIDGKTETPSYIHGAGGEDAFGVGYGGVIHNAESHLYSGMPLYTYVDRGKPQPFVKMNAFRFYVSERYEFEESFQFRFGCIGNDISSVAYWYQEGEHRDFFEIPKDQSILPDQPLPAHEHDIRHEGVGEWWLCGAMPLKQSSLDQLFSMSPDTSLVPDVDWDADSHWTKDVPADHPQTKPFWKRWRETGGFLDFFHMYRPKALGVAPGFNSVATAFTNLHMGEDGPVTIRCSYDDEAYIRINGGEPIELGKHAYFDTATIEAELKTGDNSIQVILTNTFARSWGGWAFALSARDASGVLITPSVKDGGLN